MKKLAKLSILGITITAFLGTNIAYAHHPHVPIRHDIVAKKLQKANEQQPDQNRKSGSRQTHN